MAKDSLSASPLGSGPMGRLLLWLWYHLISAIKIMLWLRLSQIMGILWKRNENCHLTAVKQNLEAGRCGQSSCANKSLGFWQLFTAAPLSTSQPPPVLQPAQGTLCCMQDGVSSWSTRKPRRRCRSMAALSEILGWLENWHRRRCHCHTDCHFTHSSIWYPKHHLLGVSIWLKG